MPTESGAGPSSEHLDWEVLARYFSGESSGEEADAVRRWLSEHPGEAAALTTLQGAAGRLRRDPPSDVAVDDAWQRIAERLDRPEVRSIFERRPRWRPALLRAAAALALVASGALIWRAVEERRDGGSGAAMMARTFVTTTGERDSVVLGDGTGVLLGPRSSLRTADGYGLRRREVRLEGEALFDVRHDRKRPFIVHAKDATIRDLGTAFAVRTGEDVGGTRVAVTSGTVLLARAGLPEDSGVVLRQGDIGATGAGRVAVLRGVPLDDELAWTRGRLVFRDTPLPVVARDLRRWYGVQLRLADSALAQRTLTASFAGDSLADVLKVIALALDVRIDRQDSVVIISRAATRTGRPR